MKIISAEKAKCQFSEILNTAKTNPVAIRKHNGHTIVLLSMKQYEFFKHLEERLMRCKARDDDDVDSHI